MRGPPLRPARWPALAVLALLAILASAPWAGAQSAAQPPVEGSVVDAGYYPLGDVDGDGSADVAFLYTLLDAESSDGASGALGLAGPDAQRVLWSARSDTVRYDWVPDLDGDGLHDVAAPPTGGDGQADSNGVLVASAGTYSYTQAATTAVLGGRDLAQVGQIAGGYESTGTFAGVFPVAAFVSAQDARSSGTFSRVLEPGLVVSETVSYADTSVFESTPASGGFHWAEDRDQAIWLADASGAVLASHETIGPHLDPWGNAVGRFDGGAPAVAAVWAESPPIVYTTSAPSPGRIPLRLHLAMVGAEGLVWQFDRDPGLHEQGHLFQVGDIDGDGSDDLSYIELSEDTANTRVTSTTLLLSGATGTVLHEDPPGDRIRLYLPFDDADGDGRRDLLMADLDVEQTDVTWGVATASGEVLWSVAPTGMPFPVNLEESRGSVRARDMTGDGVADVVLHDGLDGVQAFDGRTGEALWQQEALDLQGARVLDDLTGDGGSELLVFRASGLSDGFDAPAEDAAVSFQVIDGSNGTVLWDQLLRSPETTPLDSEGFVWLDGRSVGDVDGDGRADFTVRLWEERLQEESFPGGSVSYPYQRPTPYLFSTAAGLPLDVAALPDGLVEPAANGTAALPPPATAPVAAAAPGDGKGAPGLPAFAVAAAAAVAASLRRRR